jgi:hypothetical protein
MVCGVQMGRGSARARVVQSRTWPCKRVCGAVFAGVSDRSPPKLMVGMQIAVFVAEGHFV